MKKFTITSSSELTSNGYVLAKLVCNRETQDKAVKKKKDSIKKAGGIISPSLVVPARKCLEQGLDVVLMTGQMVRSDNENLDKILVIVDGQHREVAVNELNKEAKPGTKMIENYYFLPLSEEYKVSDLLREANVATTPWKDQHYLSNLLSSVDSPEGVKLTFLEEVSKHQTCKTKALVHYFLLDKGKELYSRDIIKAMVDTEKLKSIAKFSEDRFKIGKALFEAVSSAVTEEKAGTTVFSDWCIDVLNDNPSVTVAQMGDYLKKFFNDLEDSSKAALKEAKSRKLDDGTTLTKEDIIISKLDTLLAEYKTKNPIN